jgi:hypothetical protein
MDSPHVTSHPVPVEGNDNLLVNSSQSFNLALGCFLTSKIVRDTSGMAHEMARDANNGGHDSKLCNSFFFSLFQGRGRVLMKTAPDSQPMPILG